MTLQITAFPSKLDLEPPFILRSCKKSTPLRSSKFQAVWALQFTPLGTVLGPVDSWFGS